MHFTPRDQKRLSYHISLALVTLFVIYLTTLYVPSATLLYVLMIGFGYLSLLLIALTLLVGPFRLLTRRRNPPNYDIRRDIGIWAGITGIAHVIVALIQDERRELIDYFFTWDGAHYIARLDDFGLANYLGLIAVIIIIVLLLTSNDLSIRWLKGKRWKALQRLNYALIALVLIHTFLYQEISGREPIFFDTVFALLAIIVVAQGIGVLRYQRNQSKRPS